MPRDYLHNHPEFADLVRIVAREKSIDPALVEKDYWLMHCLYGLQKLGFVFELKGGTSLSKGYRAIGRFSEDIDIQIEPPAGRDVKTGRNQNKPAHCRSRKDFYDWLAATVRIDDIASVERDTAFDDADCRSGGIRLRYKTITDPLPGLKEGILLELGFDDVTPNAPKTISSWAYDYAAGRVDIVDNRAIAVPCYHPGYTFVEKLQTISTKFRKQQESGTFHENFLRHYYDVYELLARDDVQAFIGTPEYHAHKEKRFRAGDDPDITHNQAFVLADPAIRKAYEREYEKTSALYYGDKPSFSEILERIGKWANKL
jgi:Nucleotidyl transferase AbiEii toxin, Type IV TA system